jgi:hypothetical protein
MSVIGYLEKKREGLSSGILGRKIEIEQYRKMIGDLETECSQTATALAEIDDAIATLRERIPA